MQDLERLAICVGGRETGNRDCLASERPPTVLDSEAQVPTIWTNGRTPVPEKTPELTRRMS